MQRKQTSLVCGAIVIGLLLFREIDGLCSNEHLIAVSG